MGDATPIYDGGYLQQVLGHPIPMYVDEYPRNGSAWNPPDPRVHAAAETVDDALMLISYFHAGATRTARWDGGDDLYGMIAWQDENFAYFPSAYLLTALNHDFIGSEIAVTTSNSEKLEPFAVIPSPPGPAIGSVLLIQSVVSESDIVALDVSNLPQTPKSPVIKTMTNAGESVTAQPFASSLTLCLGA